tara:strand:+ start:4088 stop:4228 length:141 start_codon:yes stop_codon:yes gene_type:complete
MNNTKQLLTAHDIDRMYKEVEARHPKAMRHIRKIERFKNKVHDSPF